MSIIQYIKNKIIKFLGGYSSKEYLRIERKYQALLDSKSNYSTVKICNEYIYRALNKLDRYAKEELYGLNSDSWSNKMYNVIHNNMLRILIRYLNTNSSVFYHIDVTLDKYQEVKNIIINDNKEEEEIKFILETD